MRSTKSTTRGSAEAKAKARLQESQSPNLFTLSTVQQVLDWFALRPKRGEKSWLIFKSKCRQAFAEAHGALPLAECRPGHVEEFLESRGPMSGHSWNHWRTAIIEPFAMAARYGWISHNPFNGVSRKRGARGRKLTDEEVELVFNRCTNPAFLTAFRFMLHTGCRPGEVVKITAEHCDFANQRVVLPQHKTASRTGKPRILYLNPPMIQLLIYLMQQAKYRNRLDEPLFRNSRYGTWSPKGLTKYWTDFKIRVGLPANAKLHGARHHTAIRWLKEGKSTAVVKELLGHESLASTEIYMHDLDGEQDTLLAAVEGFRAY